MPEEPNFDRRSVYYLITNIERAGRYKEKTLLFKAEGRLKLYDDSNAARNALHRVKYKSWRKLPLLLRCEMPYTTEKPRQIGFRYVAQAGFSEKDSGNDHRGRKHSTVHAKTFKEIEANEDWYRVSVLNLKDFKKGIKGKLEYFRSLQQYVQKMERFMESCEEWIEIDGRLESELWDILTEDAGNHLTGGTKLALMSKGPVLDPSQQIRKDYGFTLEEYEYMTRARGTLNLVGFLFGKELEKWGRDRQDSRLIIPGTETHLDMGIMFQTLTALTEDLVDGTAEILLNGQPPQSIAEHTLALAMAAGIPVEIAGTISETLERRLVLP